MSNQLEHETPIVPVAPTDDVQLARGDRRRPDSPGRLAWYRYWRHTGAAVSTVVLAIIVLVVVASPLTARYGVNEQIWPISEGPNQNLAPSADAWFGTDSIGRDMYSRLIIGIRTSLLIGVAAAVITVVVGTLVGLVAGQRGRWADDLLMRTADIFLAFPFLIAIIIMRQFLGALSFLTPVIGEPTSIRFIVVLFAIFGWMGVARLVRGQVVALNEREFVAAARAAGASNAHIAARHLIPNSIGPILVALTLSVTAAIVGESTLSFFGFGPQPGEDSTSLGNLIELSRAGATQGNWWLVVFPCGALVLLALCISFIGDGLRDAFDPNLG